LLVEEEAINHVLHESGGPGLVEVIVDKEEEALGRGEFAMDEAIGLATFLVDGEGVSVIVDIVPGGRGAEGTGR
jgi:hypothetical protein